ncbi:MAG: HAMP domain-containing histidine kinase [Microbacterium sp.]|uniref:sensor histidine kinase n=1 Tax=Microbacterium sp. TaxID=51671 RepID=UPI001AD17CD1|nr:HAMP domain-containing sensor histidine kinase [Microbacterium sp.]MBN9177765.1 HAMP domain-containing histidine kinase [Microbacterium sp.]
MTPRSRSRWSDAALLGGVARSVWQWQLSVALSSVAVAVAVALLDPQLFTHVAFLSGLTLLSATTIGALVTPWLRARRFAILVPFIDTIAIGLLSSAESALGYLWILPVVWIATYYTALTIVAEISLILVFHLTQWRSPDASPLQVVIVLLTLSSLAVAVHQGARRTRAYRHLIRRQSRQLDRALARRTGDAARSLALFESIGTALARVDAHGRIDLSNAAYRRLYAYDDTDYRHPSRAVEYDAFRGTALPRDQTSIARAARGERITGEVLWLYGPDEQWRALSMSIRGRSAAALRAQQHDDTPGDRAGGDDISIIELVDITDGERERRDRRAATSAVSHELRNPLTVILGHADLLVESPDLSPAAREHAELIEVGAERMLTLTSSLLDTNRATEPAQGFDLRAVATSAIDAFAPAAASTDITITLDAPDPLPIAGEGFRMRQVVDNLVSNAIKYTPRGGTVALRAAREGGTAVLTVRDTGIGIAPGDLDRVFAPYFRAQSATASGIAGTGLGMSIARTIVEETGGTIALDSALGAGTTATVRLPLATQHPQESLATDGENP